MYLFYIDALNSLCLFGFSEDDRAYKKASIMVDWPYFNAWNGQTIPKKKFLLSFPFIKGEIFDSIVGHPFYCPIIVAKENDVGLAAPMIFGSYLIFHPLILNILPPLLVGIYFSLYFP